MCVWMRAVFLEALWCLRVFSSSWNRETWRFSSIRVKHDTEMNGKSIRSSGTAVTSLALKMSFVSQARRALLILVPGASAAHDQTASADAPDSVLQEFVYSSAQARVLLTCFSVSTHESHSSMLIFKCGALINLFFVKLFLWYSVMLSKLKHLYCKLWHKFDSAKLIHKSLRWYFLTKLGIYMYLHFLFSLKC